MPPGSGHCFRTHPFGESLTCYTEPTFLVGYHLAEKPAEYIGLVCSMILQAVGIRSIHKLRIRKLRISSLFFWEIPYGPRNPTESIPVVSRFLACGLNARARSTRRHASLRDRPRALKQTAPNLSIFQQTSNDEIAHCSTTCDRIMHVCGGKGTPLIPPHRCPEPKGPLRTSRFRRVDSSDRRHCLCVDSRLRHQSSTATDF